jgi:hypothetical protein
MALIAAVTLPLFAVSTHSAAAADGDSADLGTKPIVLQSARQDPLNGQQTNQPPPLDKLPSQVRDIFTTPVGTGLNSFWSSTAVPYLCNLAKDTFNGQGSSGFNLYGTTCGFASAGRVTATQQGTTVVLSYFLPRNVIEAWVTTPGTCAEGHGTIFCPTDPHVSLTADVMLQATIETPGPACDAHMDPFTAHVSNVKLDSQNLTADIAFDVASLWASLTGTDYVTTAENFIESAADQMNNGAVQMQQSVMGKIDGFTKSLCNTIIPNLPGANDIWMLNATVDPAKGIVFQLLDEPPTPSLFNAEIDVAQPTVVAGGSVKINGEFFPPNGGSVSLSLKGGGRLGTATLSAQGTFSTTVTIPAGTAAGSYTILATAGSAQAQTDIQVLAPGGNGTLTASWQGHIFTDIDLDNPFTLSGVNFAPGPIDIYLDSPNGPLIGSATVAADGTFSKDLNVSSDVAVHAGKRKVVAVQNGADVGEITLNFVFPEVIH